MTYLHFANCVALTFVPPYILYKSKLMDIASTSQIGYAAFIYVVTTLLRMILTATFVPSADLDSFDVPQELMKAFVSLADILGLHLLFQAKRSSSGIPVVYGLSWAVTESLLQRLVPLWVGARSLQFSWTHTLTSVEANISIATHISFALLVWLWSRKPALRSTIGGLVLVQRFAFPLVTTFLRFSAFPLQPTVAVGGEFVMTAVFSFITWRLVSQSSPNNESR